MITIKTIIKTKASVNLIFFLCTVAHPLSMIPSLLYAMRIADFFHKPVTSLFCYHPGVQQTPSKGDDLNE